MKNEILGKKIKDIDVGFDFIDIFLEDGKCITIDVDYENFSFEVILLEKVKHFYKEKGVIAEGV